MSIDVNAPTTPPTPANSPRVGGLTRKELHENAVLNLMLLALPPANISYFKKKPEVIQPTTLKKSNTTEEIFKLLMNANQKDS